MPMREPDRPLQLAGLLLGRDAWLRTYITTQVRLAPEVGPQALVVATDPLRDDVAAAVRRALVRFDVAVIHEPQDPPRHSYLGLTREQALAFAKTRGERLVILDEAAETAVDAMLDPSRVFVRFDDAGRARGDYWA